MRKFRRFIEHWLIKRRVTKLRLTIKRIDRAMKRDGWPNWKRKQLWRDFIKNAEVRSGFVDSIGKS